MFKSVYSEFKFICMFAESESKSEALKDILSFRKLASIFRETPKSGPEMLVSSQSSFTYMSFILISRFIPGEGPSIS